MDCPRCVGQLPSSAAECPQCGFSLEMASSAFGTGMVQLSRLVDSAHCLRLREARQIDTFLDDFQHRFPQVFLSVYLGVLPGGLNVRELSFWLLNRAAFDIPDQKRLNEYAISLVVDPVAKSAGITVGYALENVFTDKALENIILGIRTALWHGEYAAAIRRCIKALDRQLRSVGQRQRRSEEVQPPQNCEEFLDDAGWQWLRNPPPSQSGPHQPLLGPEADESTSEDPTAESPELPQP